MFPRDWPGDGIKSLSLKDADPGSFISFGNEYAKDSMHAYYKGNIIADSETKSFMGLSKIYAKDVRHVYFGVTILQNADPKSFQVVKYKNTAGVEFDEYGKDVLHVYYNDKIVENSNPNTFIFVGSNNNGYGIYKDNKHVYLRGKSVPNAGLPNCTPENISGCQGY